MDEGEVGQFGQLFREFLEGVVHAAPRPSGGLVAELDDHLGGSALEQPVTGTTLSPIDHADLQLALDGYLDGRDHRWIGLGAGAHHHESLTDLLQHGGRVAGPVVRVEVPTGVDELTSCVSAGAVLVDAADGPAHVVVVRTQRHGPGGPALAVEVLTTTAAQGSDVLAELRERLRSDSVFRGQVVSLGGGHDPFERSAAVTFWERPDVDRDAIVLPAGVLERIERRTLGFSTVADRLAAQGHNRRRGVLFHGPPGTGKTLTVRYLIGRQPERTVVVLTGRALAGGIGAAAAIARRLQPATIVLEDVDLVAQHRDHHHGGAPVLFELLNELDGFGADADVLVLLTTNRADLLEPALAARPGRVDLAVELPLPGVDERRRLLRLAADGVASHDVDWDAVAERIDGTPASFVEELVRTAALGAALDGSDGITSDHVDAAIDELLDSGSVTARLQGIGARGEVASPPRTGGSTP